MNFFINKVDLLIKKIFCEFIIIIVIVVVVVIHGNSHVSFYFLF